MWPWDRRKPVTEEMTKRIRSLVADAFSARDKELAAELSLSKHELSARGMAASSNMVNAIVTSAEDRVNEHLRLLLETAIEVAEGERGEPTCEDEQWVLNQGVQLIQRARNRLQSELDSHSFLARHFAPSFRQRVEQMGTGWESKAANRMYQSRLRRKKARREIHFYNRLWWHLMVLAVALAAAVGTLIQALMPLFQNKR